MNNDRSTDLQQEELGNTIELYQDEFAKKKNEDNYAWTKYLNKEKYKYEPSNHAQEVLNFNRAVDQFEDLPIDIRKRDRDKGDLVLSWLELRQKRIRSRRGL